MARTWEQAAEPMTAKMSIVNLQSNEELEAMFNPSMLEEEVGTEWSRLSGNGASFERLMFKNTRNYMLPSIMLYFRSTNAAEHRELIRARKQILSWAQPRKGRAPLLGGGTPDLLVCWPQMFSFEAKLIRANIKHEHFVPDGHSARFFATVQFEANRDSQLTYDQVASSVVIGDL